MINLVAPYGGGAGTFGVINGNNCSFHTCRVGFQSAMQNVKEKVMAFTHKGEESLAQIIEMIKLVEASAGIFEGAEFEETNLKNVVHITLNFWGTQSMRLSLFSLLLRGGLNFPSLELALQQEQYMMPTCGAIGRFMSGYTNFTGGQAQQWYDVFNNADDKALAKLLIQEPKLDFDEGILEFGRKVAKAANKKGTANVRLQAICEILEEIVKKKANEE